MAIKVLVVDDSAVMRNLISSILMEIEGFEVVGTASNGQDAMTKNRSIRPNVILMDIQMGEYDGVYAVRNIMSGSFPVPIILLSSLGNTNMDPIIEALDQGAFDYINKPAIHQSKIRDIKDEIKEKIECAFNADTKVLKPQKKYINHHTHTFNDESTFELILIGASTGGPTAIETILSQIPKNLPIPIVIIQHMPEQFIPSFAKRISIYSEKETIIAEEGVRLSKGIYILPGGKNTILQCKEKGVFFTSTPEVYSAYNNPSIDALFVSASEIFGDKIISVLLTGMGKDGAYGMQKIHNKKGLTIAQNQESCVVFGMPKVAAEMNAVTKMLNIKSIAPFVISAIS